MADDRDRLLVLILEEATADLSSIHGLKHWARVERNGLWLARELGIKTPVVTLFALLHDSMRRNDGFDPGHGPRAAELAVRIGHEALEISPEELEILCRACRGHTRERHSADPIIGACWDADRLDLPRVGIRPKLRFFSTDAGQKLVHSGELGRLQSLPVREL